MDTKTELFSGYLRVVVSCEFVAFVAVPVANAQMRWGASAGINVNSMKFKQDLFQVSQGVGESLGVRGEMMFPGIGLGIELGL